MLAERGFAMALTEGAVREALSDHDAKLDYLNLQVKELQDQVVSLQTGIAGAGAVRSNRWLVDLKHMSPDKFSGPRGPTPFRQWAQDIKDLCAMYSQEVLQAMMQVEHKTERITIEQIEQVGIGRDEDTQLRSALRAFTQGDPRIFINTSIDRGDGGLEIWRTLVSLYDPDNDTTRMDESTFIMNPGKAKTLGDVQHLLSRWEDTLNHRSRTLGRSPLDDDLKRSVMLKMLPEAEEKELRNQRVLYKTFEATRTRVLKIVNERTRGPAAMLYHCAEDEGGADAEEEGEWLMKIEDRNGQRHQTWTRISVKGKTKGSKGGGKGGKGVECFRRGRTGHIRGECHAIKHVNGGAPKEFKKKTLNSIDEEDEREEECGGLDLCMLEVNQMTMKDPFANSSRPLIMEDPFEKSSNKVGQLPNPFHKSVVVTVDDARPLFECPVKPPGLESKAPMLYSPTALQEIGKKTAESICGQVRASMELIVEDTIEEMQREILQQEVSSSRLLRIGSRSMKILWGRLQTSSLRRL